MKKANLQQLYSIFFFGFSSGLPFLLILSTLSVWLAEVGISKTMIGLLAWVSVPYTFKFVWGTLIDRIHIPFLTNIFGLRRSWILFAQVGLWFCISSLGNANPAQNILTTASLALLVGCFSAIQDIATEAYRIEVLPKTHVGVGASVSVLGYRVGMLCSGAGTLFLAAYLQSWSMAYTCIAACMLIGIFTTLCSAEPAQKHAILHLSLIKSIKSLVHEINWQIVFAFILSYKVADTVLNVMSMPFLIEIGFNTVEIASVAKTFGISAMILGGLIGGLLSTRISLRQNLLLCVTLQCLASGLFIVQAMLGHNLSFLFISMGVENFTCGMSQVALISYLSHLCTQGSTGMHYAILTSFASFVRVSFSSLSGWLADNLAWSEFYFIVCISCIPSLLLLILSAKHFSKLDRHTAPEVLSTTGEIFNVN